MAGDRKGLAEVCRIDDDDEDDEVGDGNAIGNNVEDIDVGKDVPIIGSSIITSKVSEMFSIISLVCILDFCALVLLLEHLNSLCKSCTCCKSRSFSLYCSSVPDLQINTWKDLINIDRVILHLNEKQPIICIREIAYINLLT